jgi:DinB family protein
MSDRAELLERFRRGPEVLAVLLTGVHGEENDFVTGAGKWSIRRITAHLADSEMVGAFRLRAVIAEDKPVLYAFDQEKWADKLDYDHRKPAQSLDAFRRLRADNHELLKSLPDAAFARTGTHTEMGEVSLHQLLEIYANHAESHARQIQAIREEYKKAKGKK